MSFPWTELLPELQHVIRTQMLDRTTLTMLALTCKAEYKHRGVYTSLRRMFINACTAGYLSVVQQVFQWLNADGDASQIAYMDLSYALTAKQWHVAEWLHEQGIEIFPSALDALLVEGHLRALKWLVAHGYAIKPNHGDILGAARVDIEVIQWLVEEQGFVPQTHHLTYACNNLPKYRELAIYYLRRGIIPDMHHIEATAEAIDVLQYARSGVFVFALEF